MNERQNAIRGMLWGGAMGDALGAPHETRRGVPIEQYSGSLQFPIVMFSRYHDPRPGVVGQVSDDTEMTLALANSLITNNGFDADAVALSYMKWANSKCPFLGVNTRNLLYGVKTIKGYKARCDKFFVGELSQSNGCLMRCSPLAVVPDYAEDDCSLTNPSPVCKKACNTYVDIMSHIIDGDDFTLEDIDERRDVSGSSKGWVLHASWCAMKGLEMASEKGKSYDEIIDWVIRLGGDTDTNACITGSLVGAYLGYEKMAESKRFRDNVEIMRRADYSTGAIPRPIEYHPSTIDLVAEKLSFIHSNCFQ